MRNQLTFETQTLAGQAAKVVSYMYDADGMRLQMNSPSGSPVDYTWTAKGQLADISRDGPPPLATYSYDKAGRLDALVHENGITEDLSYDSASQLLSRIHKASGTAISGHNYTLDNTGRRTDETFADGSTAARTYGYDNANQVTAANYGSGLTDAYNYDAMGNRNSATVASLGSSFTYTANNVNQYTSISGLSAPVHDANGNLLQQNGVNYAWDSENRLISVSPASPAVGDKALVHSYDSLHRRVTRAVTEWTLSGWQNIVTTHFLYDGWNVIEESTSLLSTLPYTLTKTLTWGTDLSGSLQGAGGVGGLLMVEEISTTTSAYHFQFDGNGNVTEITNNSGANVASYRYDAFGNTLTATGAYAATNNYRFSTKPLDNEVTNAPLYYYGYRWYDPLTGRWPSRDPIEEDGGINLYEFVGNDGLNIWLDNGLGTYQVTTPTNPRVGPVTGPTIFRPPVRPSLPNPDVQPQTPRRDRIREIPVRDLRPSPTRRQVAPRTIIYDPKRDPGSWPEFEQQNEVGRTMDIVRKNQATKREKNYCTLTPSYRRGGDSWHNKYAASLGSGEWVLTLPAFQMTPEGYNSAGYDGLTDFFLFEAKTGHQEFPWGNKRAEGDRAQQFAKQLSVANYCGYSFFIAVDNSIGAGALKGAFPQMPIFHIPFGGGIYR